MFFKTNRRNSVGIWNAERVLKAYLNLSDEEGHLSDMNDWATEPPYAVRQKRFLAVMKAYGRIEDYFYPSSQRSPFLHFISRTRSERKKKEFHRLIRPYLPSNAYYDGLFAIQDSYSDIGIMLAFEKLFEYRKKLLAMEQQWSGVLECNESVRVIIKVTNALYQKDIKQVSDKIDKMLVLLMGDDYDKTFTEKELHKYGYPDVTDEELLRMDIEDIS